jgi:hypothetical protein
MPRHPLLHLHFEIVGSSGVLMARLANLLQGHKLLIYTDKQHTHQTTRYTQSQSQYVHKTHGANNCAHNLRDMQTRIIQCYILWTTHDPTVLYSPHPTPRSTCNGAKCRAKSRQRNLRRVQARTHMLVQAQGWRGRVRLLPPGAA